MENCTGWDSSCSNDSLYSSGLSGSISVASFNEEKATDEDKAESDSGVSFNIPIYALWCSNCAK